jgi:phosphoribosylformylglycinamidine cyclo-ligase
MKTHRSYLSILKKLAAADLAAGFAHITGGGITENLPRILPRGAVAQVEMGSWPIPPIFEHLRTLGSVEQAEMMRTFNMGIGMIAVVQAEKFKKAQAVLSRADEKFYVIGRIVKPDVKNDPTQDRKVIYS